MSPRELPDISPFSLGKAEKERFLSASLMELTRHHIDNCPPYRKMMESIGFDPRQDYPYTELMFLPVQLFKRMEMISVPREAIIRTLTSSGTSGQARSKIFLDKETAANQTRVLARILSSFIGTKRAPMIIIDAESVLRDRNQLSASAAAILGFSLFGSRRIFALNEQMELNPEHLQSFVAEHPGERIILFGFTWKVYRYFVRALEKANIRMNLKESVLLHGGGWKKMEGESISPETFRKKLEAVAGIRQVHDYYGMAEQTGTISMECEYGHYHLSVYSDILIRRAHDFSLAGTGEEGIIQTLSVLPRSYPGHSLLTEDKGILLGEDDCKCGRLGKYFKITGRLEQVEIRGCSDTYEE